MNEVELSSVPQLCTQFDPKKWEADNSHPHISVWKLNTEQLKDWGKVVSQIRKEILEKAELNASCINVIVEKDSGS